MRVGVHGSVVALGLAAVLAGCGSTTQPVDTVSTGGGPAAAPCPPPDAEGTAAIDWVDFVVVDGVMLHAGHPVSTLSPDAVGEVVATVSCRIADRVGDPGFRPRSGDAAYLPAGTELHAIVGSSPRRRLAASQDGAWRVYEAQDVPGARTGADLLDLPGVTRVHLVEGERGEGVLQTVVAPADVQRLVEEVLAAAVLSSDAAGARIDGEAPLFVRFDLADGSSVQRAWHPQARVLAGALEAPQALDALLLTAPAP